MMNYSKLCCCGIILIVFRIGHIDITNKILVITLYLIFSFVFAAECNIINGKRTYKESPLFDDYPETGKDKIGAVIKSSMIWDASTILPDTIPLKQSFPVSVGFRKQFNLSQKPASALLYIFADSRYLLWINGEYVARGPNRFDPKRVEYDTRDIASWLKKGCNTIAILVQSGLSNYRFIYHKPGIGAVLEAKDNDGIILASLTTDTSWRSCPHTRFEPPVVLLSGITDRIDEHREKADWLAPNYNESSWKRAIQTDGGQWEKFCKRMIPLLRETPIRGGGIIKIIYKDKVDEKERPLDSSLPLEISAPATVLIDVGQMVRAWFEMDFSTNEESHFEILPRQSFTNRTANFIGSCHYRTTSNPGRRTYITTDDYTCRLVYLKLHEGKIKIHGFKTVERRYPFERIGSFRCNDHFLNQLWEMSIRTSEVNAIDAYIDGSEGGEWITGHIDYPVTEVAFAAPAKNENPKSGERIYSDMRLLGNQISRIALSQEGEGLIKSWHPSDWHHGYRDMGSGIHNFIEDSSLFWIYLLRIYYDGTKNYVFLERQWPVLEKVMKWFLDRRSDRGLVKAREFFLHFDNPLAYQVCEGATLNAFFYGSLIDAAYLAEKLGKQDHSKQYTYAAKQLYKAYNSYLWDDSSGTYYAGLKEGEKKILTLWPHESWKNYYDSIDQDKEFFPPTAQAAVTALFRNLVPNDRLSSVQSYLLENHYDFVSPKAYLYAFQSFYKMNTDSADQEALKTMRNRWHVMVSRKMPGTLGEQFSDRSYYCHDFGTIPSSFLSSYILGVRRDGPIWNKRIIIEPRLGDLTEADGIVITRHGPVPVEWRRIENGGLDFRVNIPEGIIATFSVPKPSDKPTLIINGEILRKYKHKNRFLTIEIGSGEYKGNVKP